MNCEIRLAGVIRESIVDGPGIRFVVFTQGCPHYCKGCHNPKTHDVTAGYISQTDNLISAIKENPMIMGVTLSGGEPFLQSRQLVEFAKEVHAMGLDILTYTGYTFEELLANKEKNPYRYKLLEQTDILIDGKFIEEQKSLMLRFRGSKNQRIIDVKKSLECGKAIETEV